MLQPQFNTVFRKHCPVQNTALYCKIILPFPAAIWSMRRVCRDTAPFYQGGTALQHLYQQPTEISMVHVFEYAIDDISQLMYEGNQVTVNPWTQRATLHIWADEFQGAHVPTHPTPVEETVGMITGLTIEQDLKYAARSGALDPKETHPDGMDYCELYTRHERRQPGWSGCADPLQPLPCNSDNPLEAKIVHCMALFIYKSH